MEGLEKMLVAFDFTPASEAVLDYATELAKVFDSRISLIHVLPKDIEHEKVKLFLRESAREKLKAVVDRLKSQGIETGESMLHYGSPFDHVVRAADTLKVNLVLLGSGEKRSDGKPHLGTTTSRIIQRCEQPVFVVKDGTSFRMKRILCPVDFSVTSRRALKNAFTLAERFQAELVILNVVESLNTGLMASKEDLDKEKSIRRARQKSKLAVFLREFNQEGLSVKVEIRSGRPSALILEEIARKHADLLVMGTTGKTGITRWIMGSVAEKVVREVPSSFVMLK